MIDYTKLGAEIMSAFEVDKDVGAPQQLSRPLTEDERLLIRAAITYTLGWVQPRADLYDAPVRELQAELDRRVREAVPPVVLFFGVFPPRPNGHFLYKPDGDWANKKLFLHTEREGYLYPSLSTRGHGRGTQEEGKLWHWYHPSKPITVLLSWDRSADKRGNCCASFVVLAEVSVGEALRLARAAFPDVFHRIEEHLGRATVLAGPVSQIEGGP